MDLVCQKTWAKSAGKVILSGEHAVVHGAPAIGCQIPLFTTCSIEESPTLTFNLKNLKKQITISLQELAHLKEAIENRYEHFLEKKIEITSVLQKEEELLLYTLALFFEKVTPIPLQITIESTIPLGSGLGSSAASISSLIKALNTHFKRDLSQEEMFQLGLKAENRQHGRSSGLDLAICMRERPIFFEKGSITEPILTYPSFKLLFTGRPNETTGSVVSHTSAIFKKDPILLNEFASVTRDIGKPQTKEAFLKLIRKNHALMKEIGVVPQKVAEMVSEIEISGGAAKITGAGALTGECGGVVLIF